MIVKTSKKHCAQWKQFYSIIQIIIKPKLWNFTIAIFNSIQFTEYNLHRIWLYKNQQFNTKYR